MGVGMKPVPCLISSECLRIMTQSGRTGYHLTHQLIYGMLAEQVLIVDYRVCIYADLVL